MGIRDIRLDWKFFAEYILQQYSLRSVGRLDASNRSCSIISEEEIYRAVSI